MRILLTQRRLLTWLTLWAMGLGALAPTLAQAALRAGDPVTWVQVCSGTGMFWVRVGEPADAPLVEGEMACPWCVLAGGADAPAAAHALLSPDAPPAPLPLAQLTALHTAASWAQPPARAPPGFA